MSPTPRLRALALAAIVVALPALGGCNVAVAVKPIFTKADASAKLVLKPGLWADVACPPPPAQKPGCRTLEVGRASLSGLFDPKTDHLPPEGAAMFSGPQPYVIADGDPPVVQVRYPAIGGIIKDGPDMVKPEDKTLPGYVFLGLQPIERDTEGDIVSLEAWLVLCGPPPPQGAPTTPEAKAFGRYMGITEHPFAGSVRQGMSCEFDSRATLHRAAGLSRQYMAPPMRMRWIAARGPTGRKGSP